MYGGPAHKHHDKENSQITALDSREITSGAWQNNTAQDVMISFDVPSEVILIMQFSDDGGTSQTEERVNLDANSNGLLLRKKGSKSFRLCVMNEKDYTLSYTRVYVYYGDFNVSNESAIVLEGKGSGTEDDPLIQQFESPTILCLLMEIKDELGIMNKQLACITDEEFETEDIEET